MNDVLGNKGGASAVLHFDVLGELLTDQDERARLLERARETHQRLEGVAKERPSDDGVKTALKAYDHAMRLLEYLADAAKYAVTT